MNQQTRITWQPSYGVGNPILDQQHQQLLNLCNQAIDCMAIDSLESRASFHLILNDLVDYTESHFKTEEAMLASHHYPLLETHRAEHLAYQVKLTDFLLEASLGHINRSALYHYLSDWWREHILCSDKQYASCLTAPDDAPEDGTDLIKLTG
jgi:hemerythrin